MCLQSIYITSSKVLSIYTFFRSKDMLCVFPSPVVTFPINDKCVTIDICSVLIKLASITYYHNIFSAGLRGYAFIVYQV